MAHWNNRVMIHRPEGDDPYLAIHEVHYDDVSKIKGWTENPTDVVSDDADSLDGLRKQLKNMQMCLEKPILEYDTGEEKGLL